MLLMLTSFFSAILLCEALLRINLPIPTQLFHFDPLSLEFDIKMMAHRFKPQISTYMTNGLFHEIVNTNEMGYRVEDTPLNSPKNLSLPVKIAAIGDSQTFGHGIPNSDTWVSKLAHKINQPISNTASFGWGPYQYSAMHSHEIADSRANLVLLGISDNDICNARPEIKPSIKNIKDVERAAAMTHWEYFTRKPVEYLSRHTAVGNITYRAARSVLKYSDFGRSEAGIWLQTNVLGRKKNQILTQDLNDPLGCIDSFIDWMQSFSSQVNRSKQTLVVVLIPHGTRIMLKSKKIEHQLYETATHNLLMLAQRNNFYVVNPTDALINFYRDEGFPSRTSLILPFDGHNTGLANEIIASEIASVMVDRNL